MDGGAKYGFASKSVLVPAPTLKQVTLYDYSGVVIASFYGAVRPTEYATLFEDAGNIYMVRWKTLPVTD